MKILLIDPSTINIDGTVNKGKRMYMPTLTLPLIAALTPLDCQIELVYDYAEDIDYEKYYDLVGITIRTTQALRGYHIADEFQKRGRKVVMGGFHSSFYPDEALTHCDSVIIAEAEYIWKELLIDCKNNQMKPIYKAEKLHTLKGLPAPRYDLLKKENYDYFSIPIETSRGCPFSCDFCCVTKFYGGKYRIRPINEVLRDVELAGYNSIYFVDDNIAVNKKHAKKLMRSIRPFYYTDWSSQASITFVKDEELLSLARDSRCSTLSFGIESFKQNTLVSINKGFNKVEEYRTAFNMLHQYGIIALTNIIFGWDEDTIEVFESTLAQLEEYRVPYVFFYTLTPYPGTKLFQTMEEAERIRSHDWSRYNQMLAVYQPLKMSMDELQNNVWKIFKSFYSISSIKKRLRPFNKNSAKYCIYSDQLNLDAVEYIDKGVHPIMKIKSMVA